MYKNFQVEENSEKRGGLIQKLGLLQDRDHYLHLQWGSGDHLSGQEAHNLVAHEVEADFGEGEECGDHPLDPQLVGDGQRKECDML